MNTHGLTAERLRELLAYDPNTGEFRFRIVSKFAHVNVGDIAGSFESSGYRTLRVDRHTYKGHRLAWLHYYGQWPSGEVDHINGDKGDNSISNLREVTRSENQQNVRSPRRDNRFGMRGVSKVRGRSKRYSARIWIDGERVTLGHYLTPEEAAEAYERAKARFHIEGARA